MKAALAPTDAKRTVWIPPGEWQDLWTGQRIVGPKKIVTQASLAQMPMWVRCGGIVFTGPEIQYTGQKPLDPVTVNVALPTNDGVWTRTLYQDDGLSNNYQKGQFAKTQVKIVKKGSRTTMTILPSTGAKAILAPHAYRIRVATPFNQKVSFSSPGQRLATNTADGKFGLRLGNVTLTATETLVKRRNLRSPLTVTIVSKPVRLGRL